MAGLQPFGGGRVKRRAGDLYPTYPSATEALIRIEGSRLRGMSSVIWEPAVGPGMIARVLAAHGFAVLASDLDPAHTGESVDFLAQRVAPPGNPPIVTNPPYALAPGFIAHAVGRLDLTYVALLLKSTFWHAASRADLFRRHPPQRIHPLGWRLDWDGRGSPPEEHCWMVWDAGAANHFPTYLPALPKPDAWPEVGWDAWVRGVA